MELMDKLQNASAEATKVEKWEGTFAEFLKIFESGQYLNLGALTHQRVYNMIMAAGTKPEKLFGNERIKFKFFEDSLFGIERSISEIMTYIASAAQKTETSRRMLLLYGPPSTGKSRFVHLLKRGLERYSYTDEGAVFALQGSKMHENPFLLIPEHLRDDFAKEHGLQIEGKISPHTAWRLEEEYKGKFMEFPVERIFLSEANRIGIGTWLPSDPKGQDISELVGGIDYAKIQAYGDEAHPGAYNFDGELFVANRGIMEYIEGLKADEKFLRACLLATQEKCVKAPRFGLIYIDDFIIMHSNETEFTLFMQEERYEAYHDRMYIVKMPYNVGVDNEVAIYEQLLEGTDAVLNMHIAPHSLEVASIFAALTRIEDPGEGDLTLVKKMKLYNGQHVKGFKSEQVNDLKKKAPREGMSGVSPRFVIDQISAAISKSKAEDRDFITPLDLLRTLNSGIQNRDSFSSEQKTEWLKHIDTARAEWNDLLRNDIQKAFYVSFEKEARNLCENYLDQIDASCSGEKPRDPVTGDEVDLDEKLMDSIEDQIDISSSGKEDFRNEIIRAVGTAARKKVDFDYTQHAQLREGIQKAMFEERKGAIRMTVSTRNPDPEATRRLNDVIDRMVKQQDYSVASANELLKYASSHLFDK